jgi:DNA-binding NtrC family response regulator
MGRPSAGISRAARERLLAYPWPGNVRELRNAIERAILLCDGGLITDAHLPAMPGALPPIATPVFGTQRVALPAENMNLDTVERGAIERALVQARGNKSQAARLLGLSRAQLYWRLDKHQID